MIYQAGQSYYSEFVTNNPNTGASYNADFLPIVIVNVNGIDSTTFILIVTNIDTGRYKVTGTVPLSTPVDSIVIVSVSATIDGISSQAIIDSFRIEDISITELYDLVESQSSSILNIQSDLKRILGLMHENIYIDLATYDVDGNMIAARVRIYSDSNSVGTSSNVIGTYEISCDAIAPGKFNNWKQVMV